MPRTRRRFHDQHDGFPAVAHLSQHLPQLGDLRRRQHGRRFVEDQDPGIERKRPGNRHELLLRRREPADDGPRLDRGADAREQLERELFHTAPLEQRQ